jgi:hypothetical protein
MATDERERPRVKKRLTAKRRNRLVIIFRLMDLTGQGTRDAL